MSFSDFADEAKNDPESIRAQLSFQSGYDKHGYVYSLARPLTGSVTYPIRTFRDTKALEQFIAEFTFFRYRGTCPSWHSVLLSSNNFSEEEVFSGTFKGKKYTPEDGKASVMQLLASGELVAHDMGSWVPEKNRNHHLPWPKPKPSIEEEFLPVTSPQFSFGPHDELGYVPPVDSRSDSARVETLEKTSTVLDEESDSKKINVTQILDELKLQGHGPQRHGGDVTRQQLIDRGVHRKDPITGTIYDAYRKNLDGSPALHLVGRNATSFKSNETFVYAEAYIRDSTNFNDALATANNGRFQVDVPAEQVLGTNYLDHLEGVTRLGSKANPTGWQPTDLTNAMIRARYRIDASGNIKLTTMYPEPQ